MKAFPMFLASLVKQYVLKQNVDKADWLIGAGLFARKVKDVALRSMKDPGTAYDDPTIGKDPAARTYEKLHQDLTVIMVEFISTREYRIEHFILAAIEMGVMHGKKLEKYGM